MKLEIKKIHYVKVERSDGFTILEADSLSKLHRLIGEYFYNNLSAFWYHWNRRTQKTIIIC